MSRSETDEASLRVRVPSGEEIYAAFQKLPPGLSTPALGRTGIEARCARSISRKRCTGSRRHDQRRGSFALLDRVEFHDKLTIASSIWFRCGPDAGHPLVRHDQAGGTILNVCAGNARRLAVRVCMDQTAPPSTRDRRRRRVRHASRRDRALAPDGALGLDEARQRRDAGKT